MGTQKLINSLPIMVNLADNQNETFVRNAFKIGNKKYFELPISELRIDQSYQRMERPKIKKMAREWDSTLCGALVVSFRDNLFYVIDGQHRLKAAQIKGEKYLPCEILTGLTQVEEAKLFVKLNTQTNRLSAYDLFNANILIGDPVDTYIKKTCDYFKVGIAGGNGGKRKQTLGSIVIARQIVAKSGKNCFRWILQILRDAKWDTQVNGYNSDIMVALKNLYEKYEDDLLSAKKVVVKTLHKKSPHYFTAEAIVEFPEHGHTTATILYLDQLVSKALEG